MAKNIKTHIFCYDDHRGFSEDVRKRFTDLSRYTNLVFSDPRGINKPVLNREGT